LQVYGLLARGLGGPAQHAAPPRDHTPLTRRCSSRVLLRWVQIALKPASKALGLLDFMGSSYATRVLSSSADQIAHSNVCKSRPACAGSILASIIWALALRITCLDRATPLIKLTAFWRSFCLGGHYLARRRAAFDQTTAGSGNHRAFSRT
jgi:hypothetical protein